MKVMLTGPRPTPMRLNEAQFFSGCKEFLVALATQSDEEDLVISGGADGADRIWARAANTLKIPYAIYVPYGYYEHYFGSVEYDREQDKYVTKIPGWCEAILGSASHVRWTQSAGKEFSWRMNFARNRQMIEDADSHVVASWVHPAELVPSTVRGGTAACVRDMAKLGVSPHWINSITGEIQYNIALPPLNAG